MNKIIKMNNIKLTTYKFGGRTPILETPKNVNNLNKIYNFFSENITSDKVIALRHSNMEKDGKTPAPIPAPSNRFVESVKFLVGNNHFTPLQTRYNSKHRRLDFLYLFSPLDFLKVKKRIKFVNEVIEILKYEANIFSLEDLFEYIKNDGKKLAQRIINNYKKDKNIINFSYSKIMKLLSKQFTIFKEFEIYDELIDTKNSNNESHIEFVSTNMKELSKKELEKTGCKYHLRKW